jgi:hypothetical protein
MQTRFRLEQIKIEYRTTAREEWEASQAGDEMAMLVRKQVSTQALRVVQPLEKSTLMRRFLIHEDVSRSPLVSGYWQFIDFSKSRFVAER